MNQENNEEKDFRVSDRRFASQSEEAKKEEEKKREETAEKEKKKTEEEPKEEKDDAEPLKLDFSNLILSLSTTALLNLGEIADPVTKEKKKDTALAKQTIDLLGILKEKTKGNLTSDEESLLENVLYDLRMRYVDALNKK